jgi:hypothetical protein
MRNALLCAPGERLGRSIYDLVMALFVSKMTPVPDFSLFVFRRFSPTEDF